jgi:hypothetical protein
MNMSTVVCNIIRLQGGYKYVGEKYWLLSSGMKKHEQNADTHQQNHMTSQPRKAW